MKYTLYFILLIGFSLWFLSGCGPRSSEVDDQATPVISVWPTFTPTQASNAMPTDAMPTDVTEVTALPSTTGDSALLLPTVTVAVFQALPTPIFLEPLSTDETATTESIDSSDEAVVALVPSPTPEPPSTSSAQPSAAQLTIVVDAVNVRNGPGTDYLQIGIATQNTQFPVVGRNEQGDWWQACCFNQQPGWLFGTLVEVQNPELVAVVTVSPPILAAATESVSHNEPEQPSADGETAPSGTEVEQSQEAIAPADPVASEEVPAAVSPDDHNGTAGNLDPNAQYQIVHYRLLGFADNNGGIFNKGGQQLIFVTVLDQNGTGVDGVVIKDAVGDKLNVVTGSKSTGKAEIKMDWDPYKLYVAADGSGAVTSQISNQMNNPYPHIPDVVGLLGPVDNEYAICPTVDDRCTPPFYHAHWSYEITFQKLR